MVTLNCTLKLSKRLPYSTVDITLPTTNRLGDWCANSFNIGRNPYILVTNERTLLSVVLSLKESATFWPRFVLSLQLLFKAIGLSEKNLQKELQAYGQVQMTRKTNRHTLGSMNEFIDLVRARFEIDGDRSLEDICCHLSEVPCGPLKYGLPKETVRQILSAATREQ
jgi:hypothetical protein